jgi:hypothetical protein
LKNVEGRPLKKDWDDEFPEWLSKLEGAVDSALSMNNIKASFCRSGICPCNPSLITHALPTTYPAFLASKRISSMLDIGNKVVSSLEFLKIWKNDEIKKKKEKRRKNRKSTLHGEEERVKDSSENDKEDVVIEEDIYGNTGEMTLMQRLENVREFQQLENNIIKNMDKKMIENKKQLKKEKCIEDTFKKKKRKREEKSIKREKGKKMIRFSSDKKEESSEDKSKKFEKRGYFEDDVVERLRDQNKKRRVVLNIKLTKELKSEI